MQSTQYSIRKNFLLPLGLVVLLSFILLITALMLALPWAKIIILTAFLIPVCLLFLESSRRRVEINDSSITVKKLFRSKTLDYGNLTSVDTIRARKRVFVSLSSENDFMIISNSYDRFGQLVEQLVERAPEPVISDETRELAADPPSKCSDIFSAWLAVGVLALVIFVQLRDGLQ